MRSRLPSVKGAREPYEAGGREFVSCAVHAEGREGEGVGECVGVPRLSAAMTTPSLNFMPSTEVPVTMGDCVCLLGPLLGCMYEAS